MNPSVKDFRWEYLHDSSFYICLPYNRQHCSRRYADISSVVTIRPRLNRYVKGPELFLKVLLTVRSIESTGLELNELNDGN
jgi:hypothetical protein